MEEGEILYFLHGLCTLFVLHVASQFIDVLREAFRDKTKREEEDHGLDRPNIYGERREDHVENHTEDLSIMPSSTDPF